MARTLQLSMTTSHAAAAASGPAIYNYTWLVLQLPFGMIGVTVLTVVMPRLSRNAAADAPKAVPAILTDEKADPYLRPTWPSASPAG